MKLYITESGDPSVGIWSQEFDIVCPFEKDVVESDDLEYFRNTMKNLYQEFCEMKVSAIYDFELKQEFDEEM